MIGAAIKEIAPLLISLITVCVSLVAVLMNKRIAYRQAVFERTAQAYEDFLSAFSAVAYDPGNPAKRDALTHAFYVAALYASSKTRKDMNIFANRVLAAKNRDDIAALDKVTPDLLSHMTADLRKTWNRKALQPIKLRNQSEKDKHDED